MKKVLKNYEKSMNFKPASTDYSSLIIKETAK